MSYNFSKNPIYFSFKTEPEIRWRNHGLTIHITVAGTVYGACGGSAIISLIAALFRMCEIQCRNRDDLPLWYLKTPASLVASNDCDLLAV